MKEILIFAGTTEGRALSEALADAGIAHTVCVATEYGEIVMREQTDAEAAGTKGQPLVSLHRGRMDRQQMEEMLLALKDADGKELYTEKNFAQWVKEAEKKAEEGPEPDPYAAVR